MTLVKICGLTNFQDAEVAIDAGADFLGFIFYDKSPRKADPEVAARIMQAFDDPTDPAGIGVFVGSTAAEVKSRLAECGLRAAQLHKLGADDLRAVKQAVYGSAFAAIQPRSVDEALVGLELVTESGQWRTPEWCPQLLVDAYKPGIYGGTGHRANGDAASELVSRVPRLVLAGGLTPDNVGEAVRTLRPWAVDVASGVEASHGIKDHGKVRAFIEAVREADKDYVNT